jgi:hypothetical protein
MAFLGSASSSDERGFLLVRSVREERNERFRQVMLGVLFGAKNINLELKGRKK